MEILKNVEIKEKALWLKEKRILIIADLHVGYEQDLLEKGIMVPHYQFKEIFKEIKELLKLNPKKIIINGDLKHEFGKINKQEWFDIGTLLDFLLKKCEVTLIKGNHDNFLKPIARKKDLKIEDFVILDDIAILHGHKIFMECLDKKIKTLVIGHDHPCVMLKEGLKIEKFKCFLLGRYHKKNLIVQPSFIPFPEGRDMQKEPLLSPLIKNVGNFEVFIIGDKVYKFGKLKNL